MIKQGIGGNKVIVLLSQLEFSLLAGKPHGEVADGAIVNLSSIKDKIDLVDAKAAELLQLKNLSQAVVTKLDDIGI